MDTTMTPKELATAIAGSNRLPSLFRDLSSNALWQAQRNLSGRTHYADAETLRYFGGRILMCELLAGNLLLGIIESVSHPTDGRLYRPVFFDIFGTVINRRDAESSFKTSKAARRAFWDDRSKIDVMQHYKAALEAELKRAQDKITQINGVLSCL